MSSTCACGTRLPVLEGRGRPKSYCSRACQQRAYRARRAESAIPAEMRAADRWMRWRLVPRTDRAGGVKMTKVPTQLSGAPAKSTDPSTWAGYDAAAASKVGDGLGFACGAGFACIDIDKCMVDGVPDERAQRLLDLNPGAYVELSPSGTGLHIWGIAPEGPGRTRSDFEFYSVGRYITVTAKVFRKGVLAPLSM